MDISQFGLGIVVDSGQSSELEGRSIAVETPILGMVANFRFEGRVKNAALQLDGSIRLGVEFFGLTGLEQSIVRALGVASIPSR